MKEKKPQSFVLSRNTLFDKSTGLTLYGLQNKKIHIYKELSNSNVCGKIATIEVSEKSQRKAQIEVHNRQDHIMLN